MRALISALVVTFAIAVTASVFAIWPVVADAPWEDDTTLVPTVDRIAELRCQGALGLRQEATRSLPTDAELAAKLERRTEEKDALVDIIVSSTERELGRSVTRDEFIKIIFEVNLPTPAPSLAEQQLALAEREIDRYC